MQDERPGRERHHERRKLGRAAPPQVQLDVQHAVPTQGQQAQQLLDDLLHQLGWAAGQREEADREEEAEAQRCQLACERVWQREQRRLAAMGRVQRKDPPEQAQEQGSSAGTPCPAAWQRRTVQGGCPAPGPGLTSAASGSGMDWLREAAWQAAHDPEAATQALLTAWVGGGRAEVHHACPALMPGVPRTATVECYTMRSAYYKRSPVPNLTAS